MILREVADADAHIAAFGETRKRFEAASNHLSDNPLFTSKITWKQVQDTYKQLQDPMIAMTQTTNGFLALEGGNG